MSLHAGELVKVHALVRALDVAGQSYGTYEIKACELHLEGSQDGIIRIVNADKVGIAELSWESDHYEIRTY